MKYIALLLLFASFSISGQKYDLSNDGLPPEYVVLEFENKTANELYEYSKNWLIDRFKSPDDVILTKVDNEMIRFEGVSPESVYYKALGVKYTSDLKYTIQIEFKDNKIKFTPLDLSYSASSTPGFWNKLNTTDKGTYYKNNGKPRKLTYTLLESSVQVIDEVLQSLNQFLSNPEPLENEDW